MNDQSTTHFKWTAVICTALVLIMAGLTLYAGSQLPSDAQVPTHWGPSGEPDAWGTPASLWMMPGICLFTTILLLVFPKFEPRRGHLLLSSKAYSAVCIGTLLFLAGMHLVMVLIALGHEVDMMLYATIGTGLLFLVIGKTMGQIRSNFIFGIRTPWTLSSERSWNQTHRLGGRLFLLLGLAMIAAGFMPDPGMAMIAVILVGIPILLIATFGYSYTIWKNDPDRVEK